MSLQKYRELSREAESSTDYWIDVAMSDFARELQALMKKRNITNAELARLLGVRRQFISKLLGGANVTLGTMVKLAIALDGVVRIRLEAKEDRRTQRDQSEAAVVVNLTLPVKDHQEQESWETAPDLPKERRQGTRR